MKTMEKIPKGTKVMVTRGGFRGRRGTVETESDFGAPFIKLDSPGLSHGDVVRFTNDQLYVFDKTVDGRG